MTTLPTIQSPNDAKQHAWSAGNELTIVAWHDPLIENTSGAIQTASDDALIWYVPIVGCTAMTMLQCNPRLLARPKRIAVHGPRRLRAFGRACRFRRWCGSRRFTGIALGRCLIRRHLLELSRRFLRRQLLGVGQRVSRPDRR